MFRHPDMWLRTFAGYQLIALTAALLAGVAFAGWLLFRQAQTSDLLPAQPTWTETMSVLCAYGFVLAVYPEQLRRNLWGELFTVIAGTLLLFVPLSVFAKAITPQNSEPAFDLLDDVTSLYAWLESASPGLRRTAARTENSRFSSPLRALASWLNPRNRPRSLILLVSVSIGVLLLAAELREGSSEPFRLQQFLKLAAAYIGLQCIGVLTGYALLARPLRLLTQTNQKV